MQGSALRPLVTMVWISSLLANSFAR